MGLIHDSEKEKWSLIFFVARMIYVSNTCFECVASELLGVMRCSMELENQIVESPWLAFRGQQSSSRIRSATFAKLHSFPLKFCATTVGNLSFVE